MKVDIQKLHIAMARACLDVSDLVELHQIPRPTINNAIQGKNLRPATMGRIAKALGVDVTEIMKEE